MYKKKLVKLTMIFVLAAAMLTQAVFAGIVMPVQTQSLTDGLSETAVSFLEKHNIVIDVKDAMKNAFAAGNPQQRGVLIASFDEAILGLIDETDVYGFTDGQIQAYVDGILNSKPIIVEYEDNMVLSMPTSSRIGNGPGYEVKSNSGFCQSTAYVTIPTAYNAGSTNAWMFYTVSSPLSSWCIDVGLFYAYGTGGNAWRGFYTVGDAVSGSVISGLSAGSSVYFNAKIQSDGYLRFRVLDGTDFSTTYYDLLYYVGSNKIYQSNGVFNRQITMTSNNGNFTNGSYISNAAFSNAYLYTTNGYSLVGTSNTDSTRCGAFGTTANNAATFVTVNSYSTWYAEDVSISF